MANFVEREWEKALNNFNYSFKLGQNHERNENYSEALNQYAYSLSYIHDSFMYIGNWLDTASLRKATIDSIFLLNLLCNRITKCLHSNQQFKHADIFCKHNRLALKSLETYSVYFDHQQLEQYKKLCAEADFMENNGELGILAEQHMNVDEKAILLNNESFEKLCTKFDEIYSNKSILLKLNNESSTSDSSCFIATAAYSTNQHPDLDTFRQFRDDKLLTNIFGKAFVKGYYKFSPELAEYISSKPAFKNFVRKQLENIARKIRKHKS
ncbi:CFI-box-CTERM domain-containing protein [Brunnivagina elsteri]|uniref:Uncharacterized protein n=1 Tax=Brunnivagina elsteri CCALA 953 TaxID=987040 RepID=A0A2A2TH06_9CYAN|nr:CFI-box-CTERM domain-containing protein [Calothrix elsteri]PAX53034.1 hypothetical protein CK510_16090 [Calothrix elsteri CCALA 953]